MSTRYIRRPVLDILPAGGEALVLLTNSRVARLSPIGLACYDLLEHPASVAELAAALEERFGPPPEGDTPAAVAAVVDGMVGAGLLTEEAAD